MKKLFFISSIFILLSGLIIISREKNTNKNIIDVGVQSNWKASCDPQKEKGKDEFDAIVIGSGIGGLSCGAMLAKNGYKIIVLEQLFHVGGMCGSYDWEGFNFTIGVEDVSGLWKHGGIQKLLDALGLDKNELFVLNKRMFLLDGKTISIDGTKKDFITQLAKEFPQEEKSLVAFMDEAEQALLESRTSKGSMPIYKTWTTVTFQQKLDAFFTDPQLKKLMCSLLGYVGTPPDKTPAHKALGACLAYFIHGGYYVKGGARSLANALKNSIEKNGGKVLTKCTVDKILVKDNKVIGIQSGKSILKSPIVVSNANAKVTFTKLLAPGTLDQNFVKAIKELKMSSSVFMVHLGVDLDLSHLPPLIKKLDKKDSFHLVINSSADPKLAPKGKASITIVGDGIYDETPKAGTLEYIQHKEQRANELIRKVEQFIPNLSKHIIKTSNGQLKDILTPQSFERYVSAPQGALYSFDQSKGSSRPYFKTPIEGLYLASSSTRFGGGIEAVAATGMTCAQDICRP